MDRRCLPLTRSGAERDSSDIAVSRVLPDWNYKGDSRGVSPLAGASLMYRGMDTFQGGCVGKDAVPLAFPAMTKPIKSGNEPLSC